MNKKEILIICLIMCFIFSLHAVAAAGDVNATDDVGIASSDVSTYSLPDNDNQLHTGSEIAETFTDLQDAVKDGGEVILSKNYTYASSDSGLKEGIQINKTTTIDGKGKVIIDAGNEARVFNITKGTAVTLKGITFINGNASGNGGSICSHGVLTIIDCKFINNTAAGHGGAIYLDNSTSSTIDNCDFEGNVAGLNGGAIDWRYGSSHGKVTSSTFTNNTAKRSGGAIHWSGHNGTIKDSNFTNNVAEGKVVTMIDNKVGGGDGGAVLWVGHNGIIDNCRFIGNKARKNDTTLESGRGGAIFLHGNSTENCTNTTISNSIFNNNIAGTNGGAIDWQEGAHEGNIHSSSFTNNTADGNGGAVFWAGHNGEIHDSNFSNNTAKGIITDIHGNSGDGGAIIWSGINGTITNTIFINNSADKRGGGVYLQNCTHGECDNTTIDRCTFTSNSAGINGGALDWHDNAHNGKISSSTFSYNTAGSNGGAVFWAGYNGEILDSNFTGNTAKGLLIDGHGNIGDGGAIIWSGINGTVDNCRFIDNEAVKNDSYDIGGRGGAVYLQNCTHGNCENTTFTNCYFYHNTAGTNGGAIDWHTGAHDGLVDHGIFINNTAKRSGGAIFWNGHNGTIQYSIFYNNSALGINNATDVHGNVTYGGDGGAVMWSGALGNVMYCNFVNNTAAKRGGAVFLQGSEAEDCDNTTFKHSYFATNIAGTNGGAIDWNEGAHKGLVDNVTFVDNIAQRSGGAIFWFGMDGKVINSIFTNNTALGNTYAIDSFGNNNTGGHGGAIMWTGSNGDIYNSTFHKNTAKVNGGAVFLQGSEKYGDCFNITVKKSIFTDNFAGVNGGAVDWYKGALNGTVDNCDFVNNTAMANGGAINWNGMNGTVINSRFNNNRATGEKWEYHWTITMEDVVVVNGNKLPRDHPITSDIGILYVLNYTNGTNRVMESYVVNETSLEWIKLDETTTVSTSLSPIDWGIDHYFGGDGGSILWSGDGGLVDNCTFENSNSARRGGGAYMTGSSYVTFSNSNFTKCTSGTNGGGVDWLAGARYGKIINCTFIDTRAARSAGAIYYDGWYGQMINITIINATSYGGDLNGSDDGLVKYAGWDSSHWDTNTTGGDGGAIMITGSHETLKNITFINCTAAGRGGAVFMQDNNNVTFDLCIFENNRALGIANNTFVDDYDATTPLNKWNTGNGGAVAFDKGASIGTIKNSKFINNTAARDGGAISFAYGSSYSTIFNSTFVNNTAQHNGGAFCWNGNEGNVSYCNFTGNRALGDAIDTDHVIFTSLSQVHEVNYLPELGPSRLNQLYVLVTYSGSTKIKYELYVAVSDPEYGFVWLKHVESNVTAPSAVDWATDEYFGGDGGSIFWGGDHGIVDHCRFIESDSARRGGGAYMEGSDNITFANCYFENTTSGTNGGGLDWLAGANYGKVINCTFNNTRAARSAGAIYYDGDYGEMTNIKIINATAFGGALNESRDGKVKYVGWDASHWDTNTTGGDGGAIMITGDHEYLKNVTFINCTAAGRGGAVFLQANDNATFESCTFENNRALGIANNTYNDNRDTSSGLNKDLTGHGGAIGFDLESTRGLIKDSKFINNTAARDGGAISYAKGSSYTTIYNVSFINNTANRDGGAIFWEGHYGTVENTVFEYNRALGLGNRALISTTVNPNTNESEKRYNVTGGDGGAIKWLGSHGIVINSTFYRNDAAYNGGSIYLGGTESESCTNMTFDGCNFTENLARLNGGAVFWASGASNATVIGTHFLNNTAWRSAGAIYINGNYLEIDDSDFRFNNASPTQTYDNRTGSSYFTSVGGNAGAICWMGSYGTVDNCQFINNTANGRGGAIQFERNRDGMVKNSLFENNSAIGDGGAIDWYLGAINGQLINSTFKSNYIIGNNGSGAGVYIEGYNATIRDSRFYDHYTNSDGGAVFVAGDECKIIDSVFERNRVGDDGAAIYWEGDYGTIVNITCYDNHGVSYNVSTSRGGAVSLIGNNVTISKSNFTYNTVISSAGADPDRLDGGAILITGSNITISDTEFAHNSAPNYGGTIFILGNETIIDNCTFENSNATRGGAIYVEGENATVSGIFKDTNATKSGGAIYVRGENAVIVNSSFDNTYALGSENDGGGAIMVNGNFTSIEKSNFTNTHASSNHKARGGAIYIKGECTNITDSQFDHSRSNLYGGAIYINGTNTTIRGSNFTDCTVNSDGSQGGAIYVNGEYTTIIGSDFDENTAKSEGGAIYIHGIYTVISNSSFEENSVDGNGGGAIFVNGDYATIEGSNFTKNEADVKNGAQGGSIFVEGKNTLIEGSNFVDSTAKFQGGAIYIDGANAKVKDSNFTNSSITGGKYGSVAPQGGAIYIKANNATVEGSIFNHSSVSNTVGEGGAIFIEGDNAKILTSEFEFSTANSGGAMYSTGSYSTVYGSNFTDNLAELNGGAIYWYGGASSKYNTVDGCIFINNTAHGSTSSTDLTRGGGAIYWSEDGRYGTVKNSKFYYNSVQSTTDKKVDGGAILWDKSYHALVDNCDFVGNFVTTNGDGGGTSASAVWAQGGAMYLRPKENYTISNCLFENCSSSKEAGALYIQSQLGNGYVTVKNSIFKNNFANATGTNVNGGGAVQIKQAQKIIFQNVQFINNSANKGGAVSVYNCYNDNTKLFDNCTFENNTAIGTNTETGYGGAIFYSDANANNLNIMNSNFTYNKAEQGSAIYSTVSYKLTNVELLKNRANTSSLDLDFSRSTNTIVLILKGWDNRLNALYVAKGSVTCSNVTYWTNNNKTIGKEDITSSSQSSVTGPTLEKGISITVELFDRYNNNKGKGIFATDENGKINLKPSDFEGVDSFEDVYVVARLTNEDYYTQVKVTTRLPSLMNATAFNTTYHRNATVNVTITKSSESEGEATGIVSVYYNDTFLGNITIADGKGTGEISTFLGDRYLEVGTHNLTLRYWGDLYNDAVNLTVPINVTKAQSNITFDYYDLGYSLYVNLTIVDDFDDVNYADANGYVTLDVYAEGSLNPTKTVLVPILDSSGFVRINELLPSNYTLVAHYHGDDNYNESINSTLAILHEKADAIVNITVNAYDIMVNETVHINVTLIVPEGYHATGNVTLYLDNEKIILPLNNSKAFFNKTGLPAGEKIVTVCYDGSVDLIPTSGDATFWVHKYNTTISANVTDITHIQHEVINITLLNDTVGVVSILVNDNEYFARINNGTATLELPLLPVGEYNVTVSFPGDDKYNNNTTFARFYVYQVTPDVIIDAENVTYGEATPIVVTLLNCAEGNVTIEIDGVQYGDPQPVINGRVEFLVNYLTAGNYVVKATYTGDANHTAASAEKQFTVYKANRTIILEVQDIYYGDVEHIKVYVNATGNVTVRVNGKTRTLILNESDIQAEILRAFIDAISEYKGKAGLDVYNLPAGIYPVDAIYNGNENYNEARTSARFIVYQLGTSLDVEVNRVINVWDKQYIDIKIRNSTGDVATNLNGTVTININGIDYYAQVINGTAKFNITENSVGRRTVWVFFEGDGNFTQSKKMEFYDVIQRKPTIEVIAKDITLGQDGNITVKLPANATGYVEIEVEGVGTYYCPASNGIAAAYPKNLKEGVYQVTVTYYGDAYDNYTKTFAKKTQFTVSMVNANVTIDVNDTVYGNDSNIVVYVDDGVEGAITITINDTLIGTYGIVNGKVNITVRLPAGNYTVHAEYEGSDQYGANRTVFKDFNVVKATPVISIDTPQTVDAATNATIIVRINATATGNITLTVNGTKYNATIENGVAVFVIDQLPAGQYDVTAEYGGDGNYTAAEPVTLVKGLAVDKVSCYQINVTASDTLVDMNSTIIIRVPGDAVGNVSVYVDGHFVGNATISEGIARLNATAEAYGNHTVNVTFTDGKYGPRYAICDFWAFKHESPLTINVTSTVVGNIAYINVTAPSDNVTIEINGIVYTRVSYENGNARFAVPDLECGNKTVVAIYGGSDNHVWNATTESFEVLKANATISITVEDITYGDSANITVNVSNGSEGFITIAINETANVTLPISYGKVNWIVEGLAVGNYTVYANYSGDARYGINGTNKTFKVNKFAPTLTIDTPEEVDANTNATVVVRIDSNAVGNITITVNGTKYNATIENGVATFTVDKLPAGRYNITAEYAGDANNTNATAELAYGLVITKVSCYQINVTASDTLVDMNSTIVIRVPGDAEGNVSVYVDGIFAGNATISQGIARLNVTEAYGNHTVNVTFTDSKYGPRYAIADFWVFKHESPVIIDVDSIVVGDIAYVNMTVPSDNVTIEINGKTYNRIRYNNGIAYFEVSGLEHGNKTVVAVYGGSDKYMQNSTTKNFTVSKRDSFINVSVTNSTVGSGAFINVTVPDDAIGYVVVTVNNINYTINLTGGKGNVTVYNLENGTYDVDVTYIGDEKYLPSTNSTKLGIDKLTTTFTVNGTNISVGQSELIKFETPDNITGLVKVEINDKNYTAFVYEGKGNLTVYDLGEGKYNVTVYFEGNNKYLPAASPKNNFTVSRIKSNITVSVENITWGDVAVVNINVTGVTGGNVTVTIGDEFNKTVGVTDGIISVVVPGLSVGNKTVNVTYNGNDIYLSSSNSTNFTVDKVDPTPYIKVIDNGNATVTVVVPLNATGNVTIYVDGNNFTGNISNGISVIPLNNITPGSHDITAVYSGDGNYTNATVTGTVTVVKMATPMVVNVTNIYVGEKALINVTMPKGAVGNVTIEINGIEYTAKITDDVARFVVENLTAGLKTVAVAYIGDANYTANFTTANFTVLKRDITITVNASDIDVGADAVINVTAPGDVAGTVLVDIDGVGYYVNITADGKGQLIVPGLGAGIHNITAKYLGDDKYLNDTDNYNFTVSKVDSFVTVRVTNITVGDKAVIEITVPGDATGNVTTVVIGDKTYDVPVANGTGILVVPGLAVGNYTVNVTYNGDDKYKQSALNSTIFSVNKIIATIKVIDLGNGTVVVVVPENATGYVNITVGDHIYNGAVVNGTAVITLDNETPGEHNITAVYSGDANYTNATVNATVVVNKMVTPMTVNVTNIYVGDKALINVTMPRGASGNVTIEINGVEYSAKIIGDVARFEIENLTAGIKTVAVAYIGDNNYVANSTTANFTVLKCDITITVNASDIDVGADAVINVTAPGDVTNPVLVDVNGVGYYVNITADGKGQLVVLGLGAGVHNITARYLGDDRYLNDTATDNFTVSKVDSFVTVKVTNITVGDKAVIEITVPVDATGNVTTIVIGDKTYHVPVANGTGILVVPGLKAGNYTVNVTYNGDDKYNVSAENSTVFSVNKLVVDDIKVIDQGNGTVVVVVPGNATGDVNITVGNHTYTAPVINGTAVITLDNETPGEHNITVVYSGDENYNNVTVNATIVVNKMATPMIVNVTNIYVGDKALINVTMPEGASGNVTIEINGVEYSSKIIGDVARFVVENLTAGIKTVAVAYIGDANYTANSTTANFTVFKRSITITVNASDIDVGADAVINVTAPGDVTRPVLVDVDGVGYYVNITADGKGQLVIPGLGAGVHNITARYIGDDRYLNDTATDNFTVSKVDSFVTVKVTNITVGDKAVIEITVPSDATGNVTTVIIGDETYHVPVANGTGILVVPGLKAGNYTVKVTYNGDDKYRQSAENSTEFSVNKLVVDDIKVIDQGNGTVVVVVPGNATGDVNITVGNHTYTAPVVNGTAIITLDNETPGEHNITVVYSGDENYNNVTVNATIVVNKMVTSITVNVTNIYVGDKALINVTLPKGASGNVTIEIDGVEYSAKVIGDVARFEIENLTAGIKTVAVAYIGDNNYVANSTTANFTVLKRSITITVNADDISVGEDVTIEVTAPGDVTRPVLVDVDGVGYYVNITGGRGLLIIPGIGSGVHDITAIYLGDDKYSNASATDNFAASKVDSFVTVKVANITVGDKAIIEITVPDDATGNVTTVVIGDETYHVPVANGTGILVVPGLKAGNYTVKVTYNGDDKYRQSAENSTEFSVNKLVVDDIKVIDQGNGTVVVVVPGNATGDVNITVGNHTYTAPVVNGTAIITLDNETPGEHNITVVYSGDENYNNVTVNATIVVNKMGTPMAVNVTSIYVGDKALINVTMPKGAGGNVTIEIDGVEYSAKIIDDVARFEIENLTAGIKTVAVAYIGDNNYVANSTTANFTVLKRSITITVNADDISVGEDVTIEVTAPGDVTRPVLVDVDGVGYYVNITEDGKGRLILRDIGSGVHDITAIYLGDDKYSNASATDNFAASKVDSFVTVKVANITVGDKAIIEITVPDDATGNVTTVVIGDKTYHVPVANGTGILVVPGLKAGNYTVKVTYNGDDKYNVSAENSTVFSVNKVTISTDDIKVIDQGNNTVVVVVPANATGDVNITVGDHTYTAPVVNGTATITLDNETPGRHNITVTYSGDENYANATVNASVVIKKLQTPMDIDVANIYVGDKAFINVTMPKGASGNVTIEIDGVEYSAKIIGDVARFEIENLTAGVKSVTAIYVGDDTYVANFTTANFTVLKRDITITVNAGDINVGEAVVINVTAPGDVTRPVLVDVDGVGYYVNITEDGKGQLVIPDIGAGVHNITARFLGDEKYSNSSATDNFTASKVDSFVTVKVANITVGDKAVIEITVPTDATGNVTTVVIGDKTYYVPVANGTGILVVSDLKVGEYTVKVTYNGDGKYKQSAENSTLFNVNKVNTTSDEIKVIDQGNNTVVVVVPANATGDVNITVGDHTYTASVVNGTATITLDNETPGRHNITVTYSGDDNHAGATVNSSVIIEKLQTPIKIDVADIYVGDKALINVTMPKGATGNVTIEIDGKQYSAKIIDDVARFEIENLTAGAKSVTAIYGGDNNYTANFTTANFTVSKRDSSVNATIQSISVGNDLIVRVNVTPGATGQVLVDIAGIGYYVNLTNGVGEISIPNIKEGKYDVNLTYLGDDKYLPSSGKANFTAEKVTPFVIPTAEDIYVGDTEVITFKVPVDATGNLTVVIDGEEYTFVLNQGTLGAIYHNNEKYTVAISGGNGELAIIGLPYGEYVVSVKYNGDDKYYQVDNTTTFKVLKRDSTMEVYDQGNGTIIVELPDNATGNVTVVIDGQTYVANVTNGTAVVNLDNVSPGSYVAEVTYSGDTTHNPQKVDAPVTIPKYSSPIGVTANNIYVGDSETVTVTLPKGATGKVTIEIDGIKYTANAKDGKAVFNVKGLSDGMKTVAVDYEGDKNYEANHTTGKFTVSKRPSTISAKGKNIKAGADEVITANVPGDATGKVLVKIGNVGYYGTIVNGVAKVIIPDLPSGTYKVQVIYEGDDKYLPSSTTITFKVTKSKTPISATGDDITVGQGGKVSVKVPKKATGKVTIKVNGKTYVSSIRNGKATFKVSGLKKGSYKVSVKYPGNRYFEANSTTTKIVVHENSTPNNGSGHGSAKHHVQAGVALTNHATGNPIWILLLLICLIVGERMRRFKK